ncbi:hypothetical protein [Lactobacillus delbrueckii]|uniref:hypothetical protein n=1 Tax=Lactobacillus delbrueckii TaxID=1584 RepID=UPI001F40E309|nr:hypothetical protein [Lactobacillus delbrueckii]GHN52197.1 hypothetical protein ME801_18660 [Lactobacillus delbrueckii]
MANKIKVDAQDVMQKTAQAAEMAEEKPQAVKPVRPRAKRKKPAEVKSEHINMVISKETRAKLEAYKAITGKTTTELFQEYLDKLWVTDRDVTDSELFRDLYINNMKKYGL